MRIRVGRGKAMIPDEMLKRYVEEQIFTLPGTARARDSFSVLLTGSRATEAHVEESDVDIDVLCPRDVFESVQGTAFRAGRIASPGASLYLSPERDWQRYFGETRGRPHFSLTPLDEVERQFRQYEDVWLWVWTNAAVLHDPGNQFRRIADGFAGYPPDVLARKIKYRWMLAAYWQVEAYPGHHASDAELLAAAASIANGVNELLRFFFLVEGRPFPYAKKLARLASQTKLGRRFGPFLGRVVDVALGRAPSIRDPWERMDEASRLLCHGDSSPDARELESACAQAMRDAGIDAAWVQADFANIDELLQGKLGPMP